MGKYFLVGFVVAFTTASALLYSGYSQAQRSTPRLSLSAPAPLTEFQDLKARSASDAKRRKNFWATNYLGVLGKEGSIGMSLNALSHADFFAELFPGYEAARTDKALWRNYFARDFDLDVFTPALNPIQKEPRGVYLSWLGCLEIHRRYGSDIVYMGSSETYRDIVPAYLATLLNDSNSTLKNGVRVLPCATGAMTMREAQFTAENLKNHRPKWLIWGFSFWSVYTKYLANSARQNAMNRLAFEFAYELPHIFPKITWDVLFPMSYKALIEARSNANQPKVLDAYFVPATLVHDPKTVDAHAARFKPHRGALREIKPSDCNLSAVESSVDAAIASMLAAADNLLIYIPPTTPLHYEAAPDCLLPAVRRLLLKKQTAHVRILVDDWKSYGLDYSDYLYASMNPQYLLIDENHTSFKGALKVTKRIGAVIKAHNNGETR